MAEMKWTNDWVRDAEEPNREFLFLLEKNRTSDGVKD
jgi:adenine-specific DNA-methyltransferase